MRRGPQLFAALLFILSACAVADSPRDPIAPLLAGRYAEVDRIMRQVQDDYKRNVITDEQLLVAFRPFYGIEVSQAHHLDRWIERYPDSYVARLARGIHYKRLGFDRPRFDSGDVNRAAMEDSHDLAARDLYASIELDDKPLLSYFHAIDLADPVGRHPAKRLLDAANAVDPENFIVRHEFLLSLRPIQGGSIEEMRAFIADSASQLSTEQIHRLESAVMIEEVRRAVRRNNDPAEAERLYREVLEFDPANNTAAWYLLYALVNRKECSEAIAVATRLLDRPDARADEVLARRGWCYLQQNKTAEGVADMQRAAELGDIWARKEIARMYWRGEHGQRDAALARHWLQKAAEQGDEKAQREMERTFGVKIATPPPQALPRWAWGTLCGVGALALLVFISWWEYTDREAAAMDRRLMRYPRTHVFIGVGGVFIFGFGAWIGFWNAYLPLRSGAFLVPALLTAMCLFIVIERLVVRHELLADGASFRGLFGRETRLKWAELRAVRYMWFMKWIRLESKSGEVVRISLDMTGLQPFARAVLVHAEHAVVDDYSRGIVEEMAEDWAMLDEPGDRGQ